MEGFEVVVVINGLMLFGFGVCFCCYRIRARKEKDIELGNKGGLSRGQVEYVVLLDRSTGTGTARGRSSLQPQRRTDQDAGADAATENVGGPVEQSTSVSIGSEAGTDQDAATENVGGPVEQPTPVSTGSEAGTDQDAREDAATENVGRLLEQPTSVSTGSEAGAQASHTAAENDEENARSAIEVRAEEQAPDAAPGPSPPRLSIIIPESDIRTQVLTIYGPTTPSTPACRQASSVGDRASLASITTPRTVNSLPTRPASWSTRWHPTSAGPEASRPSTMYSDSLYPVSVSTLPSYPGTARSTSPPAYSDLSVTRSGRTTRASNYTESVFEAMPDLSRSHLVRTRASSRVMSGYTESVIEPMPA